MFEDEKSTSSFKMMYGQHLLMSASSTQAVLSLSSGESEFYSLEKEWQQDLVQLRCYEILVWS